MCICLNCVLSLSIGPDFQLSCLCFSPYLIKFVFKEELTGPPSAVINAWHYHLALVKLMSELFQVPACSVES